MEFVDFTKCFKDITGGNLKVKQSDYSDTGKNPVVDQGKQLIGGYFDSDKTVNKSGDVIVFGDHTGIFKYINFDFILGADGVKVLEPDYRQVFPKYGYYSLQKIHIPDTGYDRKFKYLKRGKIPLPPLETQKKITAILDKADELVQNDKKILEKYDQLAQSVFLEMFGDVIRNPKGWKEVPLGELTKIRRGASPRPISEYLGGTVPWIKIGDGTKGDDIYIEYTKDYITVAGANKSVILEPGSMIFANCGVSLGFARIIKIRGCIHDGWLSFEDINDGILNRIYLLKLLNSISDYFRRTAPDGTQPNLNTGIMKKFHIPMPPISLQNDFEAMIKQIEHQKKLTGQSLKKSGELFQSLLQRGFRGELE